MSGDTVTTRARRRSGNVAELVFTGGTVLTVDARFTIAQAAAVRDGRIVFVGAADDVGELIGPETRVVELDGGALLPGINDSHLHAAMLGAYAPAYWMDAMAESNGLPTPRALRTEADREAALRRAWEVLLPLGITSYTEPGLGPGADGQHGGACGAAVLATYRRLAAAGELPVRVTALALFGELDGPCDPETFLAAVARLRAEPPDSRRRLRLAGVKIFADGIPPARTAWVGEPYPDGGAGRLLMPGADDAERVATLTRMIDAAHARDLQIGIHATGDATLGAAVAAFAAVDARHGDRDLRHYLIHGDLASGPTLRAMAHGRVGLNTQPMIYAATGELLERALGAGRAEAAFPLRAALDAGVALSLSSDGPVVAPDWRRGILAAVRRADAAGRVRGADQRIGVAEAIRAYTIVPAAQDHADAWKGSIEVGKVADLCVLGADPLAVDADEIPALPVRMTVVGGRVSHELG